MSAVLDRSSHLETAWTQVRSSLEGSPELAVKEAAWNRFLETGFPGRKDEAWRFVDVSPIAKTEYVLGDALGGMPPGDPALVDAGPRITLVNGLVVGNLPPGVTRFVPGAPTVSAAEASAFATLNQALSLEGIDIHVAAGVDAGQLHVVHVALAGAVPVQMHPRIRVRLEANAQLKLVEEYTGTGDAESWVNPVTEITVGDNAALRHVRLQREPESSRHTAGLNVAVNRDARYHGSSVVLGGGFTRVDLHTALLAPGAEADLLGLYAVRGRQVADHHTSIEHCREQTTSRQLYKGLLDEASRAVFNGYIHIREDAQQVVAEQGNENILLSDAARVNTNPQLEIHADDVKCRHGATVGQLDPARIFYLQSRGIGERRARELLTRAFLLEVAHALEPVAVGRGVERDISERFFSHV